jgi:hypothetical protein
MGALHFAAQPVASTCWRFVCLALTSLQTAHARFVLLLCFLFLGGKRYERDLVDQIRSFVPNFGSLIWGRHCVGNDAFEGCTALREVMLPRSITHIGENAFSGCHALRVVTLPDTLTNISNYAFESCTGLTEILLPSKLAHIGKHAFSGCTALTTVTLPDSLVYISNHAF